MTGFNNDTSIEKNCVVPISIPKEMSLEISMGTISKEEPLKR